MVIYRINRIVLILEHVGLDDQYLNLYVYENVALFLTGIQFAVSSFGEITRHFG